MNKTNTATLDCKINLLYKDFYSIAINCIKISLFILYLAWSIMTNRIKEFRNKNKTYLYNVNFVTVICSSYGIMNMFLSPCTITYPIC